MKRRFAILLAALLMLTAKGSLALSEPGDVNGNGAVEPGDAAAALRAVYGLVKLDNAASITADVTGSMAVSGADVTAILMKCTGKLDAFSDLVIPADSLLGESHLDAFSFSQALTTEETYRTDQVSVTLSEMKTENALCRVADVYVQSLDSFTTAFSGGEYLKSGSLAGTEKLAAENGAILAMNGDVYSQRSRGPLVRNGVWYRESVDTKTDACVLFSDGTMKTYLAGEYTKEAIEADGTPVQSWAYGPRLLDPDGEVPKFYSKFSTQYQRTMRSVLGYYEPGHYCFVSVEGLPDGTVQGMTIPELSEFMHGLGCKAAYNLVGGETSTFVFRNQIMNTLHGPSRSVSDIVMVVDPGVGGEG